MHKAIICPLRLIVYIFCALHAHGAEAQSIILETLLKGPVISETTHIARELFAQYKDKLSQTEAHFIKYAEKKLNSLRMQLGQYNYIQAFEKDPVLRSVMHEMIAIEKREAQKGNYTFVHGQPWILHFYEELYTLLWQVITKRSVQNFLFLRFKQLYFDNIQDLYYKLRKHEANRSYYIQNGTGSYYTATGNGRKNQNYIMFLNYALFTNQFGSSSARYIAKGDSENGIGKSLSSQEMFDCFGLGAYSTAFADELNQLYSEHKALTRYGHPLVISIAPAMLDQVVYVSWTGKKEVFSLADGKQKTQDVKQVLDLLRSNPDALADDNSGHYINSDHNEFSLVLSLDGALKPANGICVYSVPPVEKSKWDAYCKQRDALFDRIRQSIAKQEYGQIDGHYWNLVLSELY